jgi:hypothetical protein
MSLLQLIPQRNVHFPQVIYHQISLDTKSTILLAGKENTIQKSRVGQLSPRLSQEILQFAAPHLRLEEPMSSFELHC